LLDVSAAVPPRKRLQRLIERQAQEKLTEESDRDGEANLEDVKEKVQAEDAVAQPSRRGCVYIVRV
jgi:hypothetical protein